MASPRRAALGTILFFFAAPFTVAGLVPLWISEGRFAAPLFGWRGFRWLGGVLMAAGCVVLLDALVRFAREGRGTPAPVAPTERLVTSGLYRHTRNPMYASVLAVVVGEALLFGSPALVLYALAVGAAFHLSVVSYEEPTLRARYGAAYDAYRSAVPRWGGRLRPWRGREEGPGKRSP